MISKPLRFFEVPKEKLPSHAALFDEAEFGKAPKTLDAVDVVFSTGELVFVVMGAVVFVAAQKQAIVAEPAVPCRPWPWKAPGL